ncbi:serine/arginine repetitive matrix protein 1-like isoform X2 [Adelges cooleyi]|uniref:serine/arginine repetitive matrix protein 1-like isoform X2 n=1 Tax=Adelges cooleyi TaxID=133065 RepID=UPI0021807216|nr:serine/arginine repetitive matrix protein 1-like isoform X2 [Adelges cooleyi]
MDYNSIDDDDVESLRLAALMSCKKKSNSRMNTISSTLCNDSSYSNFTTRSNRGRFPPSNRPYNKRTYTNVGFRRPIQTNNNLISIIPTDIEDDSLSDNSKHKTKVDNEAPSQISPSTKSSGITSLKNTDEEVSTKFSRLENESGSEDSSDDNESRNGDKVDSDDGDVLLLGQEDEDLDDLDKLMDIMEAEIAGGGVKQSIKEKKNGKQSNKAKKEKLSEVKIKAKTVSKVENQVTTQPKVIEDTKISLNKLEELKSIQTVEEVRQSTSINNLSKSNFPLRSPSPIRKKSISPYSKLYRRSLTPRSPHRRSPTPDRYRYSPVRSRNYRRSLTPRRSPRRFSPLREKNLSPKRYSPPKIRYPYRSPSPRRRRRSLSRDISPARRRLTPLRRRRSRSPLRSKSRSPKGRLPPIRRRTPSPLPKSRPISPITRRKDTKILDDERIRNKDKIKLIDKEVEAKPLDPILEARKKKFESKKPIDPTSKKIILKKSNSVQVAIQTDNKKEIEPYMSTKVLHVTKKPKISTQTHETLQNINKKTENNSKPKEMKRVMKLNSTSDKVIKKRPRIIFGQEESSDQTEEDMLELSGTSDELLEEEDELEQDEEEEMEISDGNEYEEEIEKEGQESGSSSDGDEEDDDTQEEQTIDDEKNKIVKANETVDLRTELKRRRALRLNTVHVEVKKKPDSFYPARLLQSAIRGVVGTSSTDGKRKVHAELPEISIKTEGNSDGRRVIVVNREKPRAELNINLSENYTDDKKSYASVKRLKGKLKTAPTLLRRAGITQNITIHKGLRKLKKRNISVTDFNQM